MIEDSTADTERGDTGSLAGTGRTMAWTQRQEKSVTRFSPGPSGYWSQAFYTSLNALLYTLSFGRRLFLEGRHRRGRWHNWTHGEKRSSDSWFTPGTEAEIIDRIQSSPRLRVVGAGHSFNAGVRTDYRMSLDAYTGIVDGFDHGAHVQPGPGETLVRVRAGMRVREVNSELLKRGLAIIALPSHDAQSVAGILSTDVHGTGRDVGFVSASVVGLRVIDGRGIAQDVWVGDPLFSAALGGIGAVGVITEVSLKCVDAFHIRQRSKRIDLGEARREWLNILEAHDHASFYVFPFAKYVQLHTWDRTDERKSFLGKFREYLMITCAALSGAWIGQFASWGQLLPGWTNQLLRMQRSSNLVLDSAQGFNRTVYHMHQELEFTVPIAKTWEVTDHLVAIYERLYGTTHMPFTLIELRFTPANGTHGMISPGAGDQRHVYVNLVCNQAGAFAEYYAEAEAYMREIGARPHLGKWCETITHADLQHTHGAAFEAFSALRSEHDPDGRFRNAFTDRVFGPIGGGRDPLLEPLSFRTLQVKNRIFRSSVGGRFDNYDGSGTPARVTWEEQFAAGGVGAIISAFCAVTPDGAHVPNFATIESDDRIPFWKEVGEAVHRHDCKFILQLHHCGRQRDLASIRTRGTPAPSSTSKADPLNGFPAREMTTLEVETIVQAFVDGARRAHEAGLDGVELHGANGYLLSQFLSSAINKRSDKYGGNAAERSLIIVEIIEGIRRQVSPDFHVQLKFNAEDANNAVYPWLGKGNQIDDAITIAQLAVDAGADALHVSSGSSFPHPANPPGAFPLDVLASTVDTLISEGNKTFQNYVLMRYRPTRWIYSKIWGRTQSADFEGSLAPLAQQIKAAVDVPVIVTGGFQQASTIRETIANGSADAVAIARPLVANPDLVRSFEAGRELPAKPCTFCNKCLGNMVEHPMGCYEIDRFDGDKEAMIDRIMTVFAPSAWPGASAGTEADTPVVIDVTNAGRTSATTEGAT